MTQDPRLRRDASAAAFRWKTSPSPQARIPLSDDGSRNLKDVAKTLAAYGGQTVAFDLALDLALNEAVEQARVATGATGAAIALSRNGVMECRATTGKDAPDLGVRVDSESGLSGACLRSGEVQHCEDTENDPRVDADACRELGVRSMLIIPLIDDTHRYGILEVFSSGPNAFNEDDVQTLQLMARRIIARKIEAEQGLHDDSGSVEEDSHPAPPSTYEAAETSSPVAPQEVALQSSSSEPEKKTDIWTTVLVVLVIVVAVALGVLIGWRGAAKKWLSESRLRNGSAPPAHSSLPPEPSPQPPATVSASDMPTRSAKVNGLPATSVRNASSSSEGAGLVVTQNGKVIYREPPNAQVATAPTIDNASGLSSRILRRVDPEYPAAAANQHIQGPVVLDVQVLSDGTIGTIRIVSGNPLLTEAAVHAVRQWKYQPNFVNGRAVEGQTRITVNFSLPAN